MSTNKRRVRRKKTRKNKLVHEEMFDGEPAKVGCKCNDNEKHESDSEGHGGGWIQCTEKDCDVWHCIDNITDNYVLLEDEIDELQDSNNVFKCILHGFNRMKIGNKSLYQTDDSDNNNNNNKKEEQYEPPSHIKINKRKRKQETIESDYENENENETKSEKENETKSENENGNSETEIETNGTNQNSNNNMNKNASAKVNIAAPPNKKRKIDLRGIPDLEPMRPTRPTRPMHPMQGHKPYIINGKNIYQITKNELKALCRIKGVKVTGTKAQLIGILLNASNGNGDRNSNGKTLKQETKSNDIDGIEKVHKILTLAGIDDPNKVNPCLKRAIETGYVKIDLNGNGLNEIVCSGKCELCDTDLNATIKDCLYQQIYGGDDYEMGSKGGAIKHKCKENELGMYVTQICEGKATFDDGKCHNHCIVCPGFGKCCGDYRVTHCKKCNKHYSEQNCSCSN